MGCQRLLSDVGEGDWQDDVALPRVTNGLRTYEGKSSKLIPLGPRSLVDRTTNGRLYS